MKIVKRFSDFIGLLWSIYGKICFLQDLIWTIKKEVSNVLLSFLENLSLSVCFLNWTSSSLSKHIDGNNLILCDIFVNIIQLPYSS